MKRIRALIINLRAILGSIRAIISITQKTKNIFF